MCLTVSPCEFLQFTVYCNLTLTAQVAQTNGLKIAKLYYVKLLVGNISTWDSRDLEKFADE